MDPIRNLLNSFGSSTSKLSESQKRRATERFNTTANNANELAKSSSLLAGDNEDMDVDKAGEDMTARIERLKEASAWKSVTPEAKNQAKSFLGGLAPSEYLKAWKGYVAARTDQVSKSKSNPAQKQTFLTGGI